jgi:hypothetical protein
MEVLSRHSPGGTEIKKKNEKKVRLIFKPSYANTLGSGFRIVTL